MKYGFFTYMIVRIDIEAQTSRILRPETNCLPSESIFVPRLGCQGKNEGVLLISAMNHATCESNLIDIDAESMGEARRGQMPNSMRYMFNRIYSEVQS